MMTYRSRAIAVLAVSALFLTLSACQKEGPAEKAGKEVDQTMNKAGEQIEKAGDKIQDTAKDAQK